MKYVWAVIGMFLANVAQADGCVDVRSLFAVVAKKVDRNHYQLVMNPRTPMARSVLLETKKSTIRGQGMVACMGVKYDPRGAQVTMGDGFERTVGIYRECSNFTPYENARLGIKPIDCSRGVQTFMY